MDEVEEYRIALVLPGPREVLVSNDGGNARLPRISISKWTRPVEEVIAAIVERWRIKAAVVDFLKDESMPVPCAVVEVRTKDWKFWENALVAVELHKIGSHDLSDRERITFSAILTGDTGNRGPFSRLGWVDDAQEWIKSALPEREIEFSDDIRQLNACGTFALVRFRTRRGPAYWLKAVGMPNTHEFEVAVYLSQRFPKYLPPLVVTRKDWNAWVTEDLGLPALDCTNLSALRQAARSMAELQRESVRETDFMVSLGCADRRIELLQDHLSELTGFLEEVMARQTSTKVPRLGVTRLRELEMLVQDSCAKMRDLQIPDTLIHGDLNCGNILCDGARCVFIDWAEAQVGNPFQSFQHLRDLVSNQDETHAWAGALTEVYKETWFYLISETKVERALSLAPLLAIASYLDRQATWLASQPGPEARLEGQVRSLARHMDRAAQTLELTEASCR